MNFNNFTIKSQEAVQEAVNLVQSRGQQAIEPVHIMQGVMKVGENVTNFIFQKLGMNGQQVALVVDKQIDSLPKVSGGEPYLSIFALCSLCGYRHSPDSANRFP